MNLKEAYLKCRYWKDSNIVLWPNQYVIKFRSFSKSNPIPLAGRFNGISKEEEQCIIDKNDLVKKDDENGFVNVLVCPSKEKEKMLVAITDATEHRVSVFSVPETEIVGI